MHRSLLVWPDSAKLTFISKLQPDTFKS